MDHQTDAGYSGTRIHSTKPYDGAPSLDGIAVQPSSRLRKQRSNAGMRSVSHDHNINNGGMREDVLPADSVGEGSKARKGSIRNAVRKIFGRSRNVVSQGPDTAASSGTTMRHTYHRSEPTALVPPREEPDSYFQEDDLRERTLSDSYQAAHPPSLHKRTASPYAVQFPNSVRLKPMDLGNPFMESPGQLKRRKTLPSIVLTERDADAVAVAAKLVPDAEPNPSHALVYEHTREAPMPQRTLSQIKKARRKSRSADDLQGAASAKEIASRKRSAEIRYWRESCQPDVLRASGFTTDVHLRNEHDGEGVDHSREAADGSADDGTPKPPPADPFLAAAAATSRPATFKSGDQGLIGAEGDLRPSSGVGTDMSKDLEDRVAKLEAGLQNFQRSLQRLAAERNRRTIVMGELAPQRSSSDMRSPSMLAETLADNLEPSAYEYQYGHTLRPSTSPQPPLPPEILGSVDDPFGPELPSVTAAGGTSNQSYAPEQVPSQRLNVERSSESSRRPSPLHSNPPHQQYTAPAPAPVPAPAPASNAASAPAPSSSSIRTTQTQPYTFNSLYQMLSDERSARRKLETQLKTLRNEIHELHSQVNSSNMQSVRSSYMLSGSSSRLQHLLRETETNHSPPGGSPRSAAHRDSGMSAVSGALSGAHIVSRFSGSESEVGGAVDYDELATPCEAYQTPQEERSNYSLVAGAHHNASAAASVEMF